MLSTARDYPLADPTRQMFLFGMEKYTTLEVQEPEVEQKPAERFYVVWSQKEGLVYGVSNSFEKAVVIKSKNKPSLRISHVVKDAFLAALYSGNAMSILKAVPE
jgi:hypothetical protein